MDRSILWRAALVQTLAVGVLFAVLALTLPHSFFEDWGVVVGPAGWIAASLVTMRVLDLPLRTVAIASAVAGGLGRADRRRGRARDLAAGGDRGLRPHLR